MKELNSTPSKRDKKTFLIHQFLFIILLATSYPTSVFSQTYRKIAGWSDEVNNRIESFLNTTLTMNNRKVAVFDGDGTVIGQVPYYLKKLHIDTEVRRVVFIIETDHEKDSNALDNVRNLLGNKSKDFVTAVDEKNIIIVKELELEDGHKELEKMANGYLTLLKDNGEEDALIAYGTVVHDIKEVSKSYKEAKLALDVGKIFFSERNVIAYSALGIGRLIYQLPIPLCKMFIREIFEGKSPDDFDEETLATINKFFENNLNVSETSRQLYIHRNTLVYRLDKLQKSTGLDLRVFEDAITFKIALMVVKYMKYMESMEY